MVDDEGFVFRDLPVGVVNDGRQPNDLTVFVNHILYELDFSFFSCLS